MCDQKKVDTTDVEFVCTQNFEHFEHCTEMCVLSVNAGTIFLQHMKIAVSSILKISHILWTLKVHCHVHSGLLAAGPYSGSH